MRPSTVVLARAWTAYTEQESGDLGLSVFVFTVDVDTKTRAHVKPYVFGCALIYSHVCASVLAHTYMCIHVHFLSH